MCVLGVFNKPDNPRGWSFSIIKGEPALTRTAQGGSPESLNVAAISCRELEEAIAMKQVFGEKR